MIKQSSLLLLAIISLAGCNRPPVISENNSQGIPAKWINYEKDFFISYPSEAKYRFIRDDGSISFATSSGTTATDTKEDYFLEISELSIPCTPDLTAIIPGQEKAVGNVGDNTFWGIADTSEIRRKYDYFPLPNACSNLSKSAGGGGYALCSQKGERTALICLSQMTDDPALAEQIFSTFRWLD